MNDTSLILGPILSTASMAGLTILFAIILCQKSIRLRKVVFCGLAVTFTESAKSLYILINTLNGNNYNRNFRIFREGAGFAECVTFVMVVVCFPQVLEALRAKVSHEPTVEDIRFAEDTKQASLQITHMLDTQLANSERHARRMQSQ